MAKGIFYGVGVGPGDPELITLKAVRCIEQCPVIAAPETKGEKTLALDIARGAVDLAGKTILPLHFLMTRDPGALERSHRAQAERIMEQLDAGRDVAMLNLGDVSIYSTFSYLLAIISGDLVSVLFLMVTGKLWNYVELKGINKDLWKQMLHFSLPMIPAQISFWIINASDLFFVREMCNGLDGRDGNAWSGLLSTGYFLPTILTTLGLIFYDAWQLSAVTEEEGRARFFTKIFRTYSSVLFCCAAGIIWLCRPVMHVMKSNYYYAWHFVPFLVLASTCSCFNQFMNSVYVVTKKSSRSMVTMMAGAISNCLMNYFFIKWWGPIGATYASFLGLGLVFTLRSIDANRMIHMHVHPGRVLLNVGLLVFEAFVLLAETPLYGLWTGLITAVVILINFAGVWAMARVLLPRLLGRRGRAQLPVARAVPGRGGGCGRGARNGRGGAVRGRRGGRGVVSGYRTRGRLPRLVVGEELVPRGVYRRGILEVLLVHLLDQPLVGAEL